MKVLITAGGTREHIDEVRVLTNISTGKLGAQIANAFSLSSKVEKIFYICSHNSEVPFQPLLPFEEYPFGAIEVYHADSAKDVYDLMEYLVLQADVVIHSMAVGDFGFKETNIKLESNNSLAFVESLNDRIFINPKIISFIKKWNPSVKLVGFKFEVGKSKDELIDIAYKSLQKNNCDYVVANDKKEMKEQNSHIAYIVDKNKNFVKCSDKLDISLKLADLILR